MINKLEVKTRIELATTSFIKMKQLLTNRSFAELQKDSYLCNTSYIRS